MFHSAPRCARRGVLSARERLTRKQRWVWPRVGRGKALFPAKKGLTHLPERGYDTNIARKRGRTAENGRKNAGRGAKTEVKKVVDGQMNEESRKKTAMGRYVVIQVLYFTVMAVMFNYATVYLLDWGFTSGQTGILLALNSLLSVGGQQVLAALVRRTGWDLGRCAGVLAAAVALLAGVLLLEPGRVLFPVVLVAAFCVQNTLQPAINSLYRGYADLGVKMSFPLARGAGSAAYSASTFLVGQGLRWLPVRLIPWLYLVPAAVLCLCLWRFNGPEVRSGLPAEEKRGGGLADCRGIGLFLLGVVLINIGHVFSETFLLQILGRIGGGSTQLGTALTLSSGMELPAMLLYPFVAKRVGDRKMLTLAGVVWGLKSILILNAGAVGTVYGLELLQFVGYAFYVPASVAFLSEVLPSRAFLQGQALASGALTVGSLTATLVGGQLIERLGLETAEKIVPIIPAAGIACFVLAVAGKKREKDTV